jgi:hypothetical protein
VRCRAGMWRLPFIDRRHRDRGARSPQRFGAGVDPGRAPAEGRVSVGDPRDVRRGDANDSVKQEVEVDICPEQSGYILSVGPMSIWLDGTTAEDVVEMLERAISSRMTAARPATITRSTRGPRGARGSN